MREGTADNLKRVGIRKQAGWTDTVSGAGGGGLGWIEDFVEIKTVWHPVGA